MRGLGCDTRTNPRFGSSPYLLVTNCRQHEQALRQLVEHPDQLELQWSPFPLVDLDAIRSEIHALATSY